MSDSNDFDVSFGSNNTLYDGPSTRLESGPKGFFQFCVIAAFGFGSYYVFNNMDAVNSQIDRMLHAPKRVFVPVEQLNATTPAHKSTAHLGSSSSTSKAHHHDKHQHLTNTH